MSCPENTIWKVNSAFSLLWRNGDDEFVVYNTGSGDTHLLDPVAAEVLQSLEQESANLPELVDRVSAFMEIESDTEFAAYLEQLLSNFRKLRLIQRVQQ